MNYICVIEDNLAIRKLFCTLLKKGGYETIDFADGVTTLTELQIVKPNLILMDILLPDINGTELISKVKQISGLENVPVVAVTGFAAMQDEEKLKELGFSGYFSKPINTVTFLDEIKKILPP